MVFQQIVTRSNSRKSKADGFLNCKVLIIRNKDFEEMLIYQQSAKIASRRATVAIDKPTTSQLSQNQSKCFNRIIRTTLASSSTNRKNPPTGLRKNTPFVSRNAVQHVNQSTASSSSATDQLSQLQRTARIAFRRTTVAIDGLNAPSPASSQLNVVPNGTNNDGQNSDAGDSSRNNQSMNCIASNDTNVSNTGRDSDVSSHTIDTNENSSVGDNHADLSMNFVAPNEVDMSNAGSNANADVSSSLASNNEFNDSMNCDFDDANNSMDVVADSADALPSNSDSPVPEAVSLIQQPLVPLSGPIVNAPIHAKRPIPRLIPIGDSLLFKKGCQRAKKPTKTAEFISNFLSDFDDKNHRTASLETTNINLNLSVCSDESFGRLHYSDSE